MSEQSDPLPAEPEIRYPKVIAGPCSAESMEQLLATAAALKDLPISYFRAGLWKPRSRPGAFCGVGGEGLRWLQEVRAQYDFPIMTEVAVPAHVEAALKAEVDALWLGARCVSNPFSVDELAQALKGTKIPLYVKNPISPDRALWVGAIERLMNVGLTDISAVFRGYNTYYTGLGDFRNTPLWNEAFALKKYFPSIPLICDPSHIAGRRKYVEPMARLAVALGFEGLMIETHIQPEDALSDKEQQLTPQALSELLHSLADSKALSTMPILEMMRFALDENDLAMLAIISERYKLVRKISAVKQASNMPILQKDQYDKKIDILLKSAAREGLNSDFVASLFNLIHTESVRLQEELRSESSHNKSKLTTNGQ